MMVMTMSMTIEIKIWFKEWKEIKFFQDLILQFENKQKVNQNMYLRRIHRRNNRRCDDHLY